MEGAGLATVACSSGPKRIFEQKGIDDWRIQNLVLDGEAKGMWHERRDEGRSGIFVQGSLGHEIIGVQVPISMVRACIFFPLSGLKKARPGVALLRSFREYSG